MQDLKEEILNSPRDSQAVIRDQDIDSDDFKAQLLKYRAERYKSDTNDRKWLAEWATGVVSLWLIFVLLILMTNNRSLGLSDTVLVTLLGTTTLNVLGLSFIVLRGHFNGEKDFFQG